MMDQLRVSLAALALCILPAACTAAPRQAPAPSETVALPTASPDALPAEMTTPIGIPMTGECASVRQIPIEEDGTEAIVAALVRDMEGAAGQPPPSDMTSVSWIVQEGEWLLISGQPNGPGMEPAIFALREVPGGYQYIGLVWSGPGESEGTIRQHMLTVVPELSPGLVECVDVSGWVAQ